MATIRITSPQAKNHAKITVIGKPKLILVNGYYGKALHFLHAGPGEAKEGYWHFFLNEGAEFDRFIEIAKAYFGDEDYQEKPYYANGSSWFGVDKSGQDRKDAGYKYANKNLGEIVKGVGHEKLYFISHSEGCAFAAGMAKALIEKGYKVGESVMLSADEGDEFSVEGNYPCYQITAGYIEKVDVTKRRFRIDWIVGDHHIRGVTRYGVYVDPYADSGCVHAATIEKAVFEKLKELKKITLIQKRTKWKVEYMVGVRNTTWHKIDDKIVINDNIDIY
ncbi:MAG: hypothetical protein ACFNVO_02835 [Prevotella sp.]|jgi:hypothetical protein|nr:MAG: hypothetical protein D8H98_09900 [Prevotella sp.]